MRRLWTAVAVFVLLGTPGVKAEQIRIPRAAHASLLGGPPPPLLKAAPAPILEHAPTPLPRVAFRLRSFLRCAAREPDVDRARYDALIRDVAARHGLEYALVKAMIKAESDFNPLAVSPAGAQGLMQLMPGTAAEQGVCHVFHPRENVEGGCRYLRELLDRYRGNLRNAIAAYNAGARRVDDANGVPAIAETRDYLSRVLRYRVAYQREAGPLL